MSTVGDERRSLQARLSAGLRATQARLERFTLFRILRCMFESYQRNRVGEQAAAMTYYGIFSLFPLLLLFISLTGLVLQNNDEARLRILNAVIGMLPQGQDSLHQVILSVMEGKGTAAGVGIVTLLWGALGWFQVADTSINRIWRVSTPRSFVKGKLFAIGMVASIGAVGLASWLATAAVSLLAAFTNLLPGSVAVWQLAVSTISLLSIAAVLFVLYRSTPQRQISFWDAGPAALSTAVVWEMTRRALAFYMEQTDMISGYGAIGAAMALLFWIYLACTIILMGAALTYAISKERRSLDDA